MESIKVCTQIVPIKEMEFKELQEAYDGEDEVLGFYSEQHRSITIDSDMEERAKKDLIFHEAMHALLNIKYDNLTDKFQLDEEATVRLITSCKEDVVYIHNQIEIAFQKQPSVRSERKGDFEAVEKDIYKELKQCGLDGIKIVSISDVFNDGTFKIVMVFQDGLRHLYGFDPYELYSVCRGGNKEKVAQFLIKHEVK